jgi:hypothetical protein
MVKTLFLSILFVVLIWLVIPPFSNPSELINMNLASLENELGIPSEQIPGKYLAWDKSRLVGGWRVNVQFEDLPTGKDYPVSIERYMWLGIRGYSFKVISVESFAKKVR